MKRIRTMIPICLLASYAAAQEPQPAPAPPAPPAAPAAPAPAPAPAPAAAPAPPAPPVDIDIPEGIAREMAQEARELAEEARRTAEDARRNAMDNLNFDFRLDLGPLMAQVAPVPPAPPTPPPNDVEPRIKEEMDRQMARMNNRLRHMSDESLYNEGQRSLDNHRYAEALEDFSQVASRAGAHADGAFYWKAYSLIRLGRRDEAIAAIAELRKTYPNSRWLDDAKALELEAGKPVNPESESDEELKLIALNGLMQSDPDRALPILQNLLKSNQPPRLKKRAVYVLAASGSPKAQQILEQLARGGQANPDLQLVAIRYLGERRNQPSNAQLLTDIYAHTTDVNIKRAVLEEFGSGRDSAHLLEIAKTEHDPKLRQFAIQMLSGTRAADTGDALAALYASEQDQETKTAIIDALSGQRNAKALVQTARAEKDPKLKQRIVERLAGMKSPEATDYLMEILK
jgi:tetratricopeptide (TPR) repeat protein